MKQCWAFKDMVNRGFYERAAPLYDARGIGAGERLGFRSLNVAGSCSSASNCRSIQYSNL